MGVSCVFVFVVTDRCTFALQCKYTWVITCIYARGEVFQVYS